jgi:hypothetical protein
MIPADSHPLTRRQRYLIAECSLFCASWFSEDDGVDPSPLAGACAFQDGDAGISPVEAMHRVTVPMRHTGFLVAVVSRSHALRSVVSKTALFEAMFNLQGQYRVLLPQIKDLLFIVALDLFVSYDISFVYAFNDAYIQARSTTFDSVKGITCVKPEE